MLQAPVHTHIPLSLQDPTQCSYFSGLPPPDLRVCSHILVVVVRGYCVD